MNPYEEDRKNKDFIEDLFKKIFESMRKMYKNDNLEEFIQDTKDDRFGPYGGFVHGFGVNIAPHKEINVPEFKNDRSMVLNERHEKSEKSDFSTDIIETCEKIFVTVNIPGVEKEDINLNVADNALEIIINNSKVAYHKIHKLTCNVKPKVTTASYKNGVLDIVMKRNKKKNIEGKYKANID